MCFHIHNNHKEVKIAKKDITCYKLLVKRNPSDIGIFISPYRNYEYNFNKKTLYKVNNFIKTYKTYDTISITDITKGLHSFSSIKGLKDKHWLSTYNIAFKCIIPKGTKYYYNPDDKEYVSLALEFKERLTLQK